MRATGTPFLVLGLLLVSGVVACDPQPPMESPIPVTVPELHSAVEGIPASELESLLRAQALRDSGPLAQALAHPNPAVRARAALALASVQDPAREGALLQALGDDDPRVRARAAFALGQLPMSDGGAALAATLETESDPEVLARVAEALGKQGGVPAVRALLSWETDPEGSLRGARQLALARTAVRGVLLEEGGDEASVLHASLLDAFFEGLTDPDAEVREASAWAFGRMPEADSWRDRADRLVEAMEGLESDDPAGLHLVAALGGLRRTEDLGLLVDRLRYATDWRIRNTAAVAIGARQFVASDEAREALVEAMQSDPSTHVRMAAARTLAYILPPLPESWIGSWVTGPPEAWRTQFPFMQVESGLGRPGPVLGWIEGLRGREPAGVVQGLELLRSFPDPEVDDYLFDLAEDGDRRVRRGAIRLLADRWEMAVEGLERHTELFRASLRTPVDLPSAMAAARALGDPIFHSLGAGPVLEEAWNELEEAGPEPLLERILVSMGMLGDPGFQGLLEAALADPRPGVRRGAAVGLEALTGSPVRGLNLPGPEALLALEELEALGPAPVWILETERGEIRIRLLVDQAPLTVVSMARQSTAGAFNDTPFHRVIGGFVAQGGDVTEADGTGDAGFLLVSEFTELPFRRGVVGMASSGKDTEDTQFFLTHGFQAHLDGDYTAFGWIEEGAEVMDRILPGDLLLRARIETP